ncbi:hypothetical protein [Phycicoccus sp.]|uniref:hypothetical protein n=1 Tax=Phycicoccus sp. TaxID=1902410 RepID=UPI002B5D506B|nr:hypothetical protein [Phycicoccus sp.]HMM95500.1 hypothetical protein [Phycicoccus sp.]
MLDTIRSGGRQADLTVRRSDGTEVERAPDATASGEGVPDVPRHDPGLPVSAVDGPDRTTVSAAGVELSVVRRLGEGPPGPALTGRLTAGGSALRLVVVTG